MDIIELIGRQLYQWDVDRKVKITLSKDVNADEIHFAHSIIGTALVVKIYTENNETLADIPNKLLQEGRRIYVWVVKEDQTICCGKSLVVIPRAKPEDYVYTETEVLRYENLEKRIEKLEKNGSGGTADAVQYIAQKLTEEQQTQARTNIGAASAKKVSKLSEDIADLKQNGTGTGSGVTTAQANSLWAIMQKSAFAEVLTDAELNAFKTAWGIESGEEEPDIPVEPDVPEVTLTSISATYTGGEVEVGTALTDLTGLAVTATYSDGTTKTVSGYTLSGEILEGENPITVSYSNLTTTFIVVGSVSIIYSLKNTVFDGTNPIDTGLTPWIEDSDWSIACDFEHKAVNGSGIFRIFGAINTESPWNGVSLQRYTDSESALQIQYMSAKRHNVSCLQGINVDFNAKLVLTHAKGSNVMTYYIKREGHGSESSTLSSTFTQVTTNLTIAKAGAMNWSGTMNDFTLYNKVLDGNEITSYLG